MGDCPRIDSLLLITFWTSDHTRLANRRNWTGERSMLMEKVEYQGLHPRLHLTVFLIGRRLSLARSGI